MRANSKKIYEKAAIVYFIFLVPMLAIQFKLNNDTYWIIKTGEYICSNWLPKTDFLTIHSEMELVIQQWLSDVIFYKAYSLLGVSGPILILYCVFILFSCLFYKFASLISDNKIFTIASVFIGNLYIAKLYMVTRPQIFTYCIILIQLIALEKYVKTGKIKHLAVLPFLSVLSVNLHASMWTMLLIMMLPYIANSLPIKIKGKSISCCKTVPLLAATVLMVLCGLITPYGYKGLAFIFTTSLGNKVNNAISELSPFKLSFSFFDILQFTIFAIIILIYIFNKKGKTELRFVLLTAGTLVMAMLYIKLIPYFVITAYPAVLKYLQNVDLSKLSSKGNSSKMNPKTTKSLITVVFVCVAGLMGIIIAMNISDASQYIKTNGSDETTVELDASLDAISKDAEENGTDIVLYNGFNSGGYIEFKGYKAYIDPRADSFVIEANNDYDYLTEYLDLISGNIYYKEVLDKYDFTYLIVESPSEDALKINLSNDNEYEIIYSGENFTTFKKV